jgi:hypothetical protein
MDFSLALTAFAAPLMEQTAPVTLSASPILGSDDLFTSSASPFIGSATLLLPFATSATHLTASVAPIPLTASAVKGLFQPFELGAETSLIRSAVKFFKAGHFKKKILMIQSHERSLKPISAA